MKKIGRHDGPGKGHGAERKPRVSRRAFFATAAGLAAPALLVGGTRPVMATESGAAVTVREPGRLHVLALTDTHFSAKGGYKDGWTAQDIGRMVADHQPDLIIVCGDMWYNNPHGRGLKFCQGACERMAAFKTPWALARGNHDQADDSGRAEETLTSAPYSLYRGGLSGNYTIAVKDPGAAVPFWNVIIVNDAYPVLGFKEPQIEWFKAEAARIKAAQSPAPPAFVFTHIPLPQYQDAVDAGTAQGVKMEKVSFEGGSREAFPTLRDSGMVKAVFCGHDHVNNFSGELDGVRLQYLRATGHGGYGGTRARKGGTVISAEAGSGKFSADTIFPAGRGFAWEEKVRGQGKIAVAP